MSDFLNQYAGEGLDSIKMEDKTIPFINILQILSPQCQKGGDDYVKNAEPGMFYNTANKKVYGKSINVVPIKMEKVWLEWKPNRGGFVDRHEPHSIAIDKTDFKEWKYNGNIIQESYMFMILIENHYADGIAILSLSSSGIKHAKNWNTMLSTSKLPNGKPAPMFSSLWKLETVMNKNEQGTWHQLGAKSSNISRIRFVTQKEFEGSILPSRDNLKALGNPDYKQIEGNVKQEQLSETNY